MPAHRKPRQRSLSGQTARTAATLALASAASATAFDGGTAHAEPELSPAQVRAKVDQLYQEAEVATDKYNGAREDADRARKKVRSLQDEAARREDALNSERQRLGSTAAAQYRTGGIDPSLQLLLSSSPGRYLDEASLADRVGTRQAATITRVRAQLRDVEQLRSRADSQVSELRTKQQELARQKKTVTHKLGEARGLLDRLSPAERAAATQDTGSGTGSDNGSGTGRASRSDAPGRTDPAVADAPNSRTAAAIAYARQALGSPYVWGATGPNAFDCSGLTQAAYRAAGVSIPRTTYAQINAGQRVSRSQLQPGDLVFFYSGISHVGLYIGNGEMIHAPNPSAPVRIAPIDQMPFAGAARVA
ncbi:MULTISPECIES: C40 family peptidase [unclassified Streptomyces]|uniref:C40 family peptidase n=1 Tax=unclassified Streptomyces TaxID=2593676 RepID=UPI000DC56BD1|nr:C40 family peptidase [Streptomyces sp. PsTaAH-137]RAJ86267.1 cell wall-associated NlpC family hydrolase [Streptomyces sp. PsTaAH-137]